MYRPTFPLVAVNQIDIQTNSKTVNSGHTSPMPLGPALCEDGHPFVSDPVTGRKLCTCSLGLEVTYDPRSIMSDARKQGMALSGSIGGPSMGIDTSAFYAPLIRGIPIRQDRLPPYMTPGMPGQPLNFDPSLAAHPYGLLYAGMDVNGGPIRKAATRETTGPLKIWLSEHKKNPYPTKAEKIMLAIITRMTLTQVSTWFANARRRLKKENKLYPADRESRDDDDDEDEDFTSSQREGNTSQSADSEKRTTSESDTDDINVDMSDCSDADDNDIMTSSVNELEPESLAKLRQGVPYNETGQEMDGGEDLCGRSEQDDHKIGLSKQSIDHGNSGTSPGPSPSNRPKIWSISEIINGPSTTKDSHRPKGPSLQTNTHLAFPTSSLISMQKTPFGVPFVKTTSSLPASSFLSSSSSLISPTTFRPFSSVMTAPSTFHHRPELTSFVSKYGTPISGKSSTADRHAAAATKKPHTDELPLVITSTEMANTEPTIRCYNNEDAVAKSKLSKFNEGTSGRDKHHVDVHNLQHPKATHPCPPRTSQSMNILRPNTLSPLSPTIELIANDTDSVS